MIGLLLRALRFRSELAERVCEQVANMVYIESPAGVGFSYADEEDEDFRPDDASTADLNYALIQVPLRYSLTGVRRRHLTHIYF